MFLLFFRGGGCFGIPSDFYSYSTDILLNGSRGTLVHITCACQDSRACMGVCWFVCVCVCVYVCVYLFGWLLDFFCFLLSNLHVKALLNAPTRFFGFITMSWMWSM